jgi:GT2 family glycosyltransferase
VTFATGCCFLITADALRRTHGFEPSYFAYVEDVDLSYRVRAEQGLRIVYEPRARVLHRSPVGAAELSEFHILQRDRNRRRFARLRLSWAARAAFAAWFYPTRLLRAAGYALASDAMRARAVLRGAFGRL